MLLVAEIVVLLLLYSASEGFATSYQGYEERDEIQLLKCKIDALETSNKAQKTELEELNTAMTALKKEIQNQDSSIKDIRRESEKQSTYCRFMPANVCGGCTCLDDFELEARYHCDCQHLTAKRDCLEFYQLGYKVSGVYRITAGGIKTMQVYCDQHVDGGGWTLFQRRMDGNVNFYRNWEMYKHGFGHLAREHWLGNDNLFVLSLQSAYPSGSELRIDMTYWNDTKIYAKYSKFHVEGETSNYKLHATGFTGNAGDSLVPHTGQHFSTFDRDNDISSGDCSKLYRGAWWYEKCHLANLNGEYLWRDEKQLGSARGIIWWTYSRSHEFSLKRVEMKTRRKA